MTTGSKAGIEISYVKVWSIDNGKREHYGKYQCKGTVDL